MAVQRRLSTQDDQFLPDDPAALPEQFPAVLQNRSPNTGINGGVDYNNATFGTTTTPNEVPQYPANGFNPVNGWVDTKLNDADHHSAKYDFMRTAQMLGIQGGGLGAGGDRAAMSQRLGDVVGQLKTHGYDKASLIGDDKIDFGDGNGPIDVLTGKGEWWWGTPEQIAGTNAAGAKSAGGAVAFDAQGGHTPGLVDANNPFSKLLDSGYGTLIDSLTGKLKTGANRATAIEGARMPYEIARKSQLANARGELANRGLLSTPGHMQGGEVDAMQRIEDGLAPAYTGAIADRLQQQDVNDTSTANALAGALTSGTNRQGVLGNLALGNLQENRLWNSFLATYGLDRAKVMHDMQMGDTEQYLKLMEEWLKGAEVAGNGYV